MKNPSRGRFIASMLSVGGVYIFLKGMYINTMVETAQKSNAVKEDVMKAAKETYDASMRDGIKILPPEKPNCIKMIEGDNSEIKKAKDYMSDMPFHPIEDSQYINMTSNCALFIQNRGYLLPKVTQEEKHFPIAYSILTYKDVHQTERLLRSVYRPQNTYCIHVDQKASDTMRSAMSSIAKCFPNVFLASDPVKVIYAGYSRLLADIHCMQDVLKRKEKWKYYINLASQAFPLKSNREIVKILKVYNGSNDIEGIVGPRLDGIRRRFEFHFDTVFKNGQYIVDRTEKRKSKPPHNLSIVRGSAYGIFSRAFVHFIVNNNIAKDFLEWTKDTYSPDEFYWSTLHHVQSNPHLHTPGGYAGDPNNKPWLAVFAAWGGRDPCGGRWMRGVCVFGVGDLPILAGRRELFANKFVQGFEPLALDCVEEWIRKKEDSILPFDLSYYRQLPFVQKT